MRRVDCQAVGEALSRGIVRDLSTIRPTTLDGIKRLATQIKKRDDIAHSAALDAAARQAGYSSFAHARKELLP